MECGRKPHSCCWVKKIRRVLIGRFEMAVTLVASVSSMLSMIVILLPRHVFMSFEYVFVVIPVVVSRSFCIFKINSVCDFTKVFPLPLKQYS